LVVVIQLGVFLAKVFVMCSFQILVRWSLPRFRYDQLLRFAWKFMFPLALGHPSLPVLFVWVIRSLIRARTTTTRPRWAGGSAPPSPRSCAACRSRAAYSC